MTHETPMLRFVQLSDTHLHADPAYTGKRTWSSRHWVNRMIDDINTLPFPIDFVLLTGDVGHDPGGAQDYLPAREVLSRLNAPLHFMAGNHDHPKWLWDVLKQQTPPRFYYTFEQNGVQILCLNSHVHHGHHGMLGDEQLAWVRYYCTAETDMPLIVALHHHPIALGGAAIDSIRLHDGPALHETLKLARHRLRCVLYGHIHETTVTIRDGITYISALSGWFQTRTWQGQTDFGRDVIDVPGYNVVTLMADGTTMVRAYRVAVP